MSAATEFALPPRDTVQVSKLTALLSGCRAQFALLLFLAALPMSAQAPAPRSDQPASEPALALPALHEMVKKGDVAQVKALLAAAPDSIRSTDKFGFTALHHAAVAGNRVIVEFLLDQKADINASAQLIFVATPLHCAVANHRHEVAELLLNRGAEANREDPDGRTPLWVAAMLDDAESASLLLAHGAKTNTKDRRDQISPLQAAIMHGRRDILDLLLARGADVQIRTQNGCSMLHVLVAFSNQRLLATTLQEVARRLADISSADFRPDRIAGEAIAKLTLSAEQRKTLAELLLARGLGVDLKDDLSRTSLNFAAHHGDVAVMDVLLDHRADVNTLDREGFTPLCTAAEAGHVAACELLLARGAATATRTKDGRSALDCAAHGGHIAVVSLLLDQQATAHPGEPLFPPTNGRYATPLQSAAAGGQAAVVDLLLARGAPVNQRGKKGETALHCVRRGAAVKIAATLIAQGADINALTDERSTPVHYLSGWGYPDVIALLLDHGCDVNQPGFTGLTALHTAAERGVVDNVRLLLDRGAKIDAISDDGRQSIHCAAINGSIEVMRLLLARGAKVTAVEKHRATPLHWASQYGHAEAARFLLENQAAVEAFDGGGQTPLHAASASGDLATVRVLLEYGAAFDTRTKEGASPLHYAALGRRPPGFPAASTPPDHLGILKLLLAKGADRFAKAVNGETPLDTALRNGNRDGARLLLADAPAGRRPTDATK